MGRTKSLLGVLLALLLVVAGAGIAGAAPKAVIDRNHGQSVDLSRFTSVLTSMGWQVDQTSPLTAEVLNGCNLLVVPQPVSSLADSYDAIVAYVKAGGGLLVLGEAYGPELTAFQEAFGVAFNPDMIVDYGIGSENFSVTLPANPAYVAYPDGCDPVLSYDEQRFGPILNGVTSFVYNGGCSLTVDPSKVGFVVTGSCMAMSEDDMDFPPLLAATTLVEGVEGGRAVFLGDTDALTANQQLLDNIVAWLKKPEAPPTPPPDPEPPTPPDVPTTVEVTINVLSPWHSHNMINLNARGFIRVAVMSDSSFRADQVEPKSVVFAGASPVCWKLQKVHRDLRTDLVLVFWIPDLKDLTCGSNTVELTGETMDGTPIHGSDGIVVTGKCNKPPKNDKCGGKKGK